jgi:hypothetical protein
MKQFSIRDLLFVAVIVALALGWWLDRRPRPARFQIQTGPNAFILDTATGEAWYSDQGDFLGPKPLGQ